MSFVLGSVLFATMIVSAGSKIQNMKPFEERVLSIRWGRVWIARSTPFLELLLGILVLAYPRVGSIILMLFLAVVTPILVIAVRTETPCNCFGESRPARPIDIARNLVMATACVFVFIVNLGVEPPAPNALAAAAAIATAAALLYGATQFVYVGSRKETIHAP